MAKIFFLAVFLTGALARPTPNRGPCGMEACSSQALTRHTLSGEELASLSSDLRDLLQRKATELSNVWADTILEGDYYADTEVRLDSLEEIFRGNRLIAYRITYSAKAWDTGSCDFDAENLKTLAQCESGRIFESGFVSQDLRLEDQDPDALAEFVRNN